MESKTVENSITSSIDSHSTASAGGSSSGSVVVEQKVIKEEILINSQVALFFDKLFLKPEELWQLVNSEMGDIFDQTPIIFPVPNDPNLNEVPIVQMSSKSGVYVCNISRGRIDFVRSGSGKQKFNDIKDDFKNEISKLFNFLKNSEILIKRIGFVTNIFISDEKQDETLKEILSDKFTKIFSGDTHEVFTRYVTKETINGYNINNFTTLGRFNARISGIPNEVRGILITRDFNTVPSDNYSNKFSNTEIENFIETNSRNFKLDELKDILWQTAQ